MYKIESYSHLKVTNGVCLDGDSHERCEVHDDCAGKGGKCCNAPDGYCCSEAYFGAMKELPCKENFGCQVRGDEEEKFSCPKGGHEVAK